MTQRPEARAEIDRLIVRRVRIGLTVMLVGAAVIALADVVALPALESRAAVVHAGTLVLLAVGLFVFSRPSVVRRPVPFALATVAIVCGLRALTGIWRGESTPTLLMAVMIALTAGASIPWGLAAQATAALLCGAAVAINAWWVPEAYGPAAERVATIVVVALAISVVLAHELQRHWLRVMEENAQRRRAEADLARLNADLERRVAERTGALAAVIDNTTDAIWSVDRDGRPTVINRVARQRLRAYFDADADGADLAAHVPAPLWAELTALYARAFAGEHAQLDYVQETPHGPRHLHLAVHPIRAEAGGAATPSGTAEPAVLGATVFSQDVTERVRAEERAREHRDELAHVLRVGTMGEMAAGLAHEINQPLGAISNYASGAVHRLREGALQAPALLPILEEITHEALRAGDIIRRLRELVRKQAPEQRPVDVTALARASAQLVAGEARRRDVTLKLALAPQLPGVVGDAIQIEQVLLNLLLNGIEAAAGAAHGPRHVALRTTHRDGAIAVEVTDSGAGLPDADVFAPYFTTKPDGLGLGLSISRSIVEAHGGRLDALATPGSGATFRLTLPAASA